MKETLGKILRIFTTVLMVLSICMMIFTVISVLTFNRSDRQLFGYRAFIVLSDSMSATDFKAGDLVLTRDVDPATLQPGDIIAFTSTNDENYGQTVTHKIRSLTTTADGEPGFITYGTTTGTDDTAVVTYMDVLGKYAGHLAGVGTFFNFLPRRRRRPCTGQRPRRPAGNTADRHHGKRAGACRDQITQPGNAAPRQIIRKEVPL